MKLTTTHKITAALLSILLAFSMSGALAVTANADDADLIYGITHQPTATEPFVEVTGVTDVTYQWYLIEDVRTELTSENASGVKSDGSAKSDYTAENGWSNMRHDEVNYFGYYHYDEYFEIYLKAGQTVEIIPSLDCAKLGIWADRPSAYDERMNADDVKAGTPMRFTALTSDYYQSYSFGDGKGYVKAYIVNEFTPIEGATEPSFTPTEIGVYACEVTVADGLTLMSETFEMHIFPTEWSKDDTHHWKECECGERSEYAEHTDANADHTCDVCGAELPGGGEDQPEGGLPTGAVAGIVIGAVAVFAIGGFAVYYFLIKRKPD